MEHRIIRPATSTLEAHYNTPDREIEELIARETLRQSNQLTLIASENYASPAVRAAAASVLTNKYAEGYPGRRYYGGCAIVDQVEQLAQERACRLFQTTHANVQPHSGSSANFAAYQAVLKPGDTILGMALASGGHLTHGHSVSFSGMNYHAISYQVDPTTGLLDFAQIEELAHTHRPRMIIAGASSYARTIDFARFARIARSVDAVLVADIAHIAGLVVTGLHPSPVGHADIITSTTHKTLRGPRGGLILAQGEYGAMIDRAIMPGTQGGPLMHIIAAKAVAFHEALQPSFVLYQQQVIATARRMAAWFERNGYRVITGGTDTHLFVLDLSSTRHTGLSAEQTLETIGIIVSRSTIPNETRSPRITSGIRIGTPALVTRGFTEHTIDEVAELIHRTLCSNSNLTALHDSVKQLAACHPTP